MDYLEGLPIGMIILPFPIDPSYSQGYHRSNDNSNDYLNLHVYTDEYLCYIFLGEGLVPLSDYFVISHVIMPLITPDITPNMI